MSHQVNETKTVDTRGRILDAVTELILSGGLAAVTLSAVCNRAGISKGGLMHHYPSKEAMVEAFLDRAGKVYLEQIESAMISRNAGSGRRAAAYVDLFLGNPASMSSSADRECAAVMVALVQGGGHAEMRQLYQRLLRLLCEDGLTTGLAELIIAAVDGVWLQSMIEAPDALVARASRLQKRLKRLIRDEFSARNLNKRSSDKSSMST